MVVLIYDVLGEMKERGRSVVDIASQLTEIEQFVLSRATDHFEMYGLQIEKLSGLYVSMPEKVQEAVDTRSSMQVLGTDYMGYQTGQAIEKARQNAPRKLKVEVEVETVAEAEEALRAGADIVMVDNMCVEDMRRVVEMNEGRAVIEASGGVTLDNVLEIARTEVDLISVGALTHSASALDMSLSIEA